MSEDDSDAMQWAGPLLAGGRLYLVNSKKQLVQLSPYDGKITATYDLPDKALLSPIISRRTMFVLTDGGELVAFR